MSRFTIALLLLISSTVTSSAAGCHGAAEVLGPDGKYCYIVQFKAKNFADAEKACYQYGGYQLVKISNMIENNFLWNMVKSDGDVFIGATDVTSDGSWKWQDGTPATFVNWAPAPKVGSCASMRAIDGRWMRDDCETLLPSICYGPALGEPTNAPLFHEGLSVFFVGDSESMGSPVHNAGVGEYYTKEKEFIKSIADTLFTQNVNGNSICDVWADVSFYGYSSIQQQFEDGYIQKREEFDESLEKNDFMSPDDYQMTNITTAITDLRQFHWTPYLPQTMGSTVLVFFTGRQDFTGIPSIVNHYYTIDEVVVVQMNGSKMPLPANNPKYTAVSISNDFNSDDLQRVVNVLKCH